MTPLHAKSGTWGRDRAEGGTANGGLHRIRTETALMLLRQYRKQTLPFKATDRRMAAHLGSLNKPQVDDRIIATGSDATPDPDIAASDEAMPPISVVGHPASDRNIDALIRQDHFLERYREGKPAF